MLLLVLLKPNSIFLLTNPAFIHDSPSKIPPLSLIHATRQPKQASQNPLHHLPKIHHLHSCRYTILRRARLYDHGAIR